MIRLPLVIEDGRGRSLQRFEAFGVADRTRAVLAATWIDPGDYWVKTDVEPVTTGFSAGSRVDDGEPFRPTHLGAERSTMIGRVVSPTARNICRCRVLPGSFCPVGERSIVRISGVRRGEGSVVVARGRG